MTIENDIATALLSNYTPSKITGLKRHSVKLPDPIPEENDEGEIPKTKKRFDFDRFAKKREEQSRKQLEKNLSASKLSHLLDKAGVSKTLHPVPIIKKLQRLKRPLVSIQLPVNQEVQ